MMRLAFVIRTVWAASCPFAEHCENVDQASCGNACCGMFFAFVGKAPASSSIDALDPASDSSSDATLADAAAADASATAKKDSDADDMKLMKGVQEDLIEAVSKNMGYRLSHMDGNDGNTGFVDITYNPPVAEPKKFKQALIQGQVIHQTDVKKYNDTINFIFYSLTDEYRQHLLPEDVGQPAMVLHAFSWSQIGGAYSDAGQNYRNIVVLTNYLRDNLNRTGTELPTLRQGCGVGAGMGVGSPANPSLIESILLETSVGVAKIEAEKSQLFDDTPVSIFLVGVFTVVTGLLSFWLGKKFGARAEQSKYSLLNGQ